VRPRHGFSMVELIVILVIMLTIAGILASSSAVGVRDTVGRSSAVTLDAVLVAQQSWAAHSGGYTADATQLFTLNNDLTVTADAPVGIGTVGMSVGSGGTLALTTPSGAGRCHVLTASPWPQPTIDRFESEVCAPSHHLPVGESPLAP
jgi:type II secretory pathway pseudopilin PulG